MNTANITIDKRQLIIIVSFVVMLLVVFVYWQIFYLPKSKEISTIYAKVKDFDVNIKEEEVKVKAQGYEEEIARTQAEVARLQDKFPSQNELPGLFQDLFTKAKKFNIEIISIEPDKPSVYKSKASPESDLVFNRVPIKLKLQASYRDLAEFLKSLYENPQYAFSFDDLELRVIENEDQKLEVYLSLGAFVLSHEGAAPIEEQDLKKGLDFNLMGNK